MIHKFSRLLMTLVALFVITAGAWADEPTVYNSGTVDLRTLKMGDILMSGVTLVNEIESWDVLRLEQNRFAQDGITQTAPQDVEAPTIGENGQIEYGNHTYTPVTEGGEAGGAWVVLSIADASYSGHNYKIVSVGGIKAPITVTWNAATNTGTFDMPASDVVLTPLYAPVAAWAEVESVKQLPAAAEGVFAGTTDPIIVEGTVAPGQGQVMYAVTSTNQATAPALSAFSATVPTAENIADEGADVLVWYYIQGADTPDGQEATAENTFNDSEICATPLEVSVLSNQFDITFNAANANTIEGQNGKGTVTVKTGDAEAVDKTADIDENHQLKAVKMGSEVKMTAKQGYKFKSVKAKKAAAGPTLDLATVTADITVEDGYTLTGTLGANVKISIADGATVTLDGVTINRVNNSNYKWAGINCLGDATIILSGTNTVKGFYDEYPGIHVPQDKTLTIDGSGSLTASSKGFACGIGGGDNIACGNIVIAGGTITATGGNNSAGIGGGNSGSCGNISITGGTITANGGGGGAGIGIGDGGSCGNISITGGTINATGGNQAAGIGGGYGGSCGNITITNGVTSVTATKGNSASHSIGVGSGNGTCGTVTIGGATGAKSESPYTYQPSN